jgi:methylthioribose-1-phosphate isomerase
MPLEPIRWNSSGLSTIDQTLLPGELRHIELKSAQAVWEAIKQLRVRKPTPPQGVEVYTPAFDAHAHDTARRAGAVL